MKGIQLPYEPFRKQEKPILKKKKKPFFTAYNKANQTS